MDISFDVGGTFTDIVVRENDSGLLHIEKLPTEAVAKGTGIASVIQHILHHRDLNPARIRSLTHATTLPSNMIIGRSGGRIGMVVNRGFRDVLELGFESRFDLYNFDFPTVEPLVPRQHRYQISARVLADGSVESAVDENEVRELALVLEQHAVHAVAVCLLHSYRYPQQEELVESLLRESGYSGHIELSSRICPEIREYPRMSTTVLNAYITPMIGSYLDTLAFSLKQEKIDQRLDLTTSHGGRLPAQVVRQRSVELLESGAAATVLAAAEVAKSLQIERLLSFEMGGTTAKIAVVLSAKPILTDRYEVARLNRSKPGSGLPVQMPAIDLVEIGAGGGSIASLNQVGLVTVGPQSAGSRPGPACYGKGGMQPTVTDACLLLGYLSTEGILDGSFPLDRSLAERSVRDALTSRMPSDSMAASEAVYDVTAEMMANTARVHLLEHGLNPEDFTLVANGGAGPLFAAALATRIGIARVIVMPHAGVGSAIGMINSPPSVRLSRSRLEITAGVERENIHRLLGEMRQEALGCLAGQESNQVETQVACSMRYRGQGHEITFPVDLADAGDIGDQLHACFEAAYRSRYGRTLAGAPSEILGWQLEVTKTTGRKVYSYAMGEAGKDEPIRTRSARFSGRELEVRVLQRKSLKAGQRFAGPVIVEERETTTIVPPQGVLSLDAYGNLIIDLEISMQEKGMTTEGSYDRQALSKRISLENIWLRLVSIADEAATTLIRTAYSVTIRESRDLTVVICDAKGRAIAECSNANPSFIGTLPRTIRAFLSQIPSHRWHQGDLVITNDPWIGSGHLQDITMASPVFVGQSLAAFVLVAAHGPDIGGSLYSAMSREIFEEGLRIPVCHYAERGRRNQLVSEFITANVRVPDKVIGDLEGMAACSETAGNKIKQLIGQISIEGFDSSIAEIISRSRNAMELAIENLPEGRYRSAATTSGIDRPLLIRCEIEVKGRQLRVSYDGTAPAQPRGINVPLCYTYAHTVYPLKSLLLPDVPNNHGTLQPVSVNAPEGSLLNPTFPAPVAARHLTGQFLSGLVVSALAEVLPQKAFAECGVTRPQLIFSGRTAAGERFVEHLFMVSGIGARNGADGKNALCFPANTTATAVEIIESMTPLIIECREILPDSGGRGEWRGGCGQRLRVRNGSPYPVDLSILAELSHRGASGLHGGEDGSPTRIWVDDVRVADKARLELMPNSVLTVESAGGGGYGVPANRSGLLHNQDLESDYVSNNLVG